MSSSRTEDFSGSSDSEDVLSPRTRDLLIDNPFLNTPAPPAPIKPLPSISRRRVSKVKTSYSSSIDLEDLTCSNNDSLSGSTEGFLQSNKALEVLGVSNDKRPGRQKQKNESQSTPMLGARSGSVSSLPERTLSTQKSKTKAMKLMGMDKDEEFSKAEEEVATSLLSTDSQKKSFRYKFKGMLKRSTAVNPRRKSDYDCSVNIQIVEALESLTNEPYYCNQITSNNDLHVKNSFPIDNFIRQSGSPMKANRTNKTNSQNRANLRVSTEEKTFSAPVGLGMMHMEFDRWWQETQFNGEAFFTGMFFHTHADDIVAYIKYICDSRSSKISKAIHFIQQVTNTSNYNALEELRSIDVFSGNKTVSIGASSSTLSLISNLGEFHVRSSLEHRECCLGTRQPFEDWDGSITSQKILGRRVRFISCGSYHYGAITETNEIILWGNNTLPGTDQISGQIPSNSTEPVQPPTILTDITGKPLFVSCGAAHTVIVTTEGLFSCGNDTFGQLGRDNGNIGNILLPIPGIVDRYGINCVIGEISCGANHTAVCTEDGLVFTWGANHFGQLAHSPRLLVVREATVLTELGNIVSVACGSSHSVFLDISGKVYTAGSNTFGELGVLDALRAGAVNQIEFDHPIAKISAGPYSTTALTEIGTVYQWGILRGPNMTQNQSTPRLVNSLIEDNKFVVGVASGITHTVFQTDESLSELLPTLLQCCSYSDKFYGGPLLKSILALPNLNRSFKYLQDRALYSILKEKEHIPTIIPDEAYFKVEFASSRKSGYFLVTLRNPNDFPVLVSTITGESKQNQSQKIVVEPETFRIPKRGEQNIKILVLHMKPPTKKTQGMIHFTSERKDKSNSENKQFAHCFIIYASVPKKRTTEFVQKREETFGSLQLVKNLSTYVPAVLLQYMATHPQPPTEPHIQQFPAAILFLDISGFTSLNERLAQLGAAGPELVSKHINSYFASLIKAVSEHGGDVLKFAGDALICMWAGETPGSSIDNLTSLTLRAIQCGFDIQTRLDKYDSNEGFSLTLHIGVGSGELLSLWAGSEGSWEYLVSGEPLAQLRTAVDNSKTGEVVISTESWNLVQEYCKGEPRGNDIWVSEIVSHVPITRTKTIKGWPRGDAEAALRCFIPVAVQVSVDSQQLEGWGNELRAATVLFVKLNSDIPNDNKEVYLSTINTVLCCMQQAIFKYEGMVRQFLADDKGTVLIAAFGLPPFCHIEDPLRGVKAAMEIHQELKTHDMDCSIGVTTGQVYCGSVGCPVRQEYAMVGDVVNLSARLMVAAFKQNANILCDQPTYEASNEVLSFATLDPIMVKGKKNAIAIYQPLATDKKRKSRYRKHRGEVFGRKQQKKQIRDAVLNVVTPSIKEKGTIILQGVQGMGKSVLCNYAIGICKRKKILVCHGEGDHFQKNVPLYPWRSIMKDLLSITDVFSRFPSTVNKKRLSEALEQNVAKSLHDTLPLLNELLGDIYFEEGEDIEQLSKEDRVYNLTHLLKHILNEFSLRSPFVIVVEDLHWVDNDSLSLLQQVVRDISSILVIVTSRTQPPCQNFVHGPRVIRFELLPLSEKEVTDIVLNLLQVDALPQAVSYLFRSTHGNPLVAREIASELLESGVIEVKDRKLIVTGNLSDMTLSSITGMIKTKLDRLPSGQQMVLKVASVIGFEFGTETLLQIYPFENNQKKFIQGEINALQTLGLVNSAVSEGEPIYTFENQQLLESFDFCTTNRMHENIAVWYESLPNSVKRNSQIAYHWATVIENSKDTSCDIIIKAIGYLEQAGAVAAIAYGADIARVWREKALELNAKLPDSEKKTENYSRLTRLLQNASADDEQLKVSLREISGVGGPCHYLQ